MKGGGRKAARGKQDDATPDIFADAVAVGDKPPPKAGAGSGGIPAKPLVSSSGNGDDSIDMAAFAERSYLTYAMSVVRGRAIPNVEDVQKPVQRRILYVRDREIGRAHV